MALLDVEVICQDKIAEVKREYNAANNMLSSTLSVVPTKFSVLCHGTK